MNFSGSRIWSGSLIWSETPGFFSTSPINITYLFFEKVFLIWQHIVREKSSLRLLDELMYVAFKHG